MANEKKPKPANQVQENQQPIEQVKTPRQRAEELIGYLNHDKAVNDLFSDAFEKQYLIYGKSPKEWRRYFKVTIPEDPDTAQCKALAARVAALTQEVNFFFAAAEAQLDALASGESKEFTSAFNQTIAEFRSKGRAIPASKTIEQMANEKTMDIKGAVQNAKIIKNFWKRLLDGLVEVRKNVELATWNNHTQSKQEQYSNSNIPGYQPNRGEFGRAKE